MEYRNRRAVLAAAGKTVVALASAAVASAPLSALAQSFPQRPVKLIVAFPPGGANDVIARELGKELSALWGQAVVIDNKPGAAGMVAASEASRAPADGHTLFVASDGAMVAAPLLTEKPPYNPLTDLAPVAMIGGIPLILVASPSLKVSSMKEFLAAAKARPDQIDYASSGIGASHHLSMEKLQRVAGIKLHHIIYKGGAPALQAVLASEVPVTWVAVSTVLPHIQAGKVVPLAVGSLERLPLLPNVPTVAELGFPGFEAGNWLGIAGPRGISHDLVRKIQGDLQKVATSAPYRERLAAQGNEGRFSTAEDFGKRIRTDYNDNKAFFTAAGLRKD